MPTKMEIYSTADFRIHVRIQDIFEFGMSIADTKKFIADLERALAQLEAATLNAEIAAGALTKEHDAICRECEGEWDEEEWCETNGDICPYCGQPMLDDIEVGQGYHITAPCWMWATGLRKEAAAWEAMQHD